MAQMAVGVMAAEALLISFGKLFSGHFGSFFISLMAKKGCRGRV